MNYYRASDAFHEGEPWWYPDYKGTLPSIVEFNLEVPNAEQRFNERESDAWRFLMF